MAARARSRRNDADWGRWTRKRITPTLIGTLAAQFRDGAQIKEVAEGAMIPAGILRRWLEAGAEEYEDWHERDDAAPPSEPAMLHARCMQARAEAIKELRLQLKAAGAGKDSSPGSAGWLLERLANDQWGLANRLEVSGVEGAPIMYEGRAIVGLAEVTALARQLGQGHLFGLDAGDSQRALPAAGEVLPDPEQPEQAAGATADVSRA